MKSWTFDDGKLLLGDCLKYMSKMKPKSVDLVFGSPPYEAARTYGIDFKLRGQDWVDWMVQIYLASLRICKGLVAFVVEGQTRDYSWSGVPMLLAADLIRSGVTLRKPPAFARVGICGSGGSAAQHRDDGGSADWLRNDYEFIICATHGGKLPWADTLAMGHKPKWAPGGEMSHRLGSGARVNQWGSTGRGLLARNADGSKDVRPRPSHRFGTGTKGKKNGDLLTVAGGYDPPAIANPGNVIECKVGGGHLGSNISHENEAPFPEKLPTFFVRSFCPPGGTVYDPFCGSGTTVAMAIKWGRRFFASDVRESQIKLTLRRIKQARLRKGFVLS